MTTMCLSPQRVFSQTQNVSTENGNQEITPHQVLDSILVYPCDSICLFCWDTTYPYIYFAKPTCKRIAPGSLKLDTNMTFVMPVPGAFMRGVSSYHSGWDIDLETGDSVHLAFDGTVRYAGNNKDGYGNLVIVRHCNGLETWYAHLDKILTKPNRQLQAGAVIGLGGCTGKCYGSHVHWEFRYGGKILDIAKYIDFKGRKIIAGNPLP